jgi:hypothetical protein
MKMKNIQHSTFNLELPMTAAVRTTWALDVECWMLNVPRPRSRNIAGQIL